MTFPEIRTRRLVLRALKKEEKDDLFALRFDPVVSKYIAREVLQPEAREAFIERIIDQVNQEQVYFWVLSRPETPELMGTICLWNFSDDRTRAEVGYELHHNFHRQGYMQEALEAVLLFGFEELNLQTIEAYTHRDNLASVQLLARNHFELVPGRTDQDNSNNIIFTLDRENQG